MKIGILALQGGVIEHIHAAREAARNLDIGCEIIEVRTKKHLEGLDGLIIPGGESTVLQKLCQREGIFEEIKKVPAIFGTCAGAIFIAKKINNRESEQKTLELMDIEVDRNGYGRQNESFEQDLDTTLGKIHAIFIRAPRIKSIGSGVKIIAKNKNEIVACEEHVGKNFYLVTCFHPELSTSKFHEYFLNFLR
ncbi:Pyridoxal 5'-phosphate synthase subunit PdxT [Candidatus Bilamarchaeum dharawalense]|uniref:glutaminase n=1 Tax=Candidatus Bilamarchaeum dharawalense TaxID=2885759 RepID=A0A5E4LPP7_9ARCH|nr:Pyridoxal 5'-phosphate synthase subunit PdxT [Candidatus Bilamarchaeum dharawalense]